MLNVCAPLNMQQIASPAMAGNMICFIVTQAICMNENNPLSTNNSSKVVKCGLPGSGG